jgi:hypothetical protein
MTSYVILRSITIILILTLLTFYIGLVFAQQEGYSFITKWGSKGSDTGQFNNPYSLAVDSSRNVYVGDLENHRIQKFDSNGTFITKWGSNGSNEGQFDDPFGIIINSDDVYVSDKLNHRIQKFTILGSR